jgi:hypothetical protein
MRRNLQGATGTPNYRRGTGGSRRGLHDAPIARNLIGRRFPQLRAPNLGVYARALGIRGGLGDRDLLVFVISDSERGTESINRVLQDNGLGSGKELEAQLTSRAALVKDYQDGQPPNAQNVVPLVFMLARFIGKQTVLAKKRRGPAPTGKGVQVVVRLQPDPLTALDKWAAKQSDRPTRAEAIRRLVEIVLKAKK